MVFMCECVFVSVNDYAFTIRIRQKSNTNNPSLHTNNILWKYQNKSN